MMVADNSVLFIVVVIVVNPAWIYSAGLQTGMPLSQRQHEDLESAIRIENGNLQISLEYLPVVEGVSAGLQLAVRECKRQLKWYRWNCPVHWSSLLTRTSVFKATRETAYVQAISAAGIVYHVSKRCKQLSNGICDCGQKLRKQSCEQKFYEYPMLETFSWTGCQRNFQFGEKVARMFLGMDDGSSTAASAMKRHNELAGIETVTRSLVNHCKCHGPTGSCTWKTCWHVLPDFRHIGSRLKKRYKMSKKTQYMNQHEQPSSSNEVRNQSESLKLVYSETSPDYCYPDKTTGHPGTIGRDCKMLEKGSNETMPKWERSSCRRLCKECGHKVLSEPCLETIECGPEDEFCDWDCKPCVVDRFRYFCG